MTGPGLDGGTYGLKLHMDSIPIERLYELPDVAAPLGPEPSVSWQQGSPIAIDLGTYQTRIGYAGADPSSCPSSIFYTQVAKYRDRKSPRTFVIVGNDIYLDATARSQQRSPFDGPVVTNWELLETMLDYSFSKLGVAGDGNVDHAVAMSELAGVPASQRRGMSELLFETYGVPSVGYGVDALFSYRHNRGTSSDGIVISAGHEATHVIPVCNGKGVLSLSRRINWGGRPAASFLQNLLALKYPYFPSKLTTAQSMGIIQEHCYVSQDYSHELAQFLKFEPELAQRERVLQVPFVEVVATEKSEEELARQAERRKESGRRLQEQAAKKRLEKLVVKEQQVVDYRALLEQIEGTSNGNAKRNLEAHGFRDESHLKKYLRDLERSIKHSRKMLGEDIDDNDDGADEPPSFPLVDVPDQELDPDQIKEKRRQKLLKANYDARMRAKQEKEAEKVRLAELEAKEAQWRESDLEGWLADKRGRLREVFETRRERDKLKAELSDRKSHASQLRMRAITGLADNSPDRTKRRRTGASAVGTGTPVGTPGPEMNTNDDTFGADDSDWAIYRKISNEQDSDEEEQEERMVQDLIKQLTEFDPDFVLDEYTGTGRRHWRDSVVHMFVKGPREYDGSQAEQHQLTVNVERIRVPEVLFQPSMAGVDQAGLIEVVDMVLKQVSGSHVKDIFVTGGLAKLPGFAERLAKDLTSILPAGAPLKVNMAGDVQIDCWRGMSQWAVSQEYQDASVTRDEYLEKGGDYLKEHGLGNDLI